VLISHSLYTPDFEPSDTWWQDYMAAISQQEGAFARSNKGAVLMYRYDFIPA
jgi:hypothetical protein